LFRQQDMRVEMLHHGWVGERSCLERCRARCTRWREFYAIDCSVGGIACGVVGGARLMSLHRRDRARIIDATVEEILVSLGQSLHARTSFWYP